MIAAGEESEGKSAREGTEVRTEGYPRHTFVKSTIGTLRSRIARPPPGSCGNSQVLSSRSRRCIDPCYPPSSLFLPFRSSFVDPLSCSLSLSLFHSHYGLPIFSPRTSLFFLLVASRSRRPHAGRDVTRPTRGRIQTSAFFFISR